MEAGTRQHIPMSDEIDRLNRYLRLESARLDNRIDFKLEVDPTLDVDTLEMPTMIIQPLVENAIWHGLGPKSEGGSVWGSF